MEEQLYHVTYDNLEDTVGMVLVHECCARFTEASLRERSRLLPRSTLTFHIAEGVATVHFTPGLTAAYRKYNKLLASQLERGSGDWRKEPRPYG